MMKSRLSKTHLPIRCIALLTLAAGAILPAFAQTSPPYTSPATYNPTSSTNPASNAPLASMEELQQIFDQKEYRVCSQQLSRVLMLAAPRNSAYDLYKVNMLKGQCLLYLKDPGSARYAFDAAVKLAPDAVTAAVPRAYSALIQKSAGYFYRPKGDVRAEPISITDPETLKKALQAFFDDQMAAAKLDIPRIAEAKSLPEIFRFAPDAVLLVSLELALTGKDTASIAMLMPLAERIYGLIDTSLDSLDGHIANIQSTANQAYVTGTTFTNQNGRGAWTNDVVRVGLSSDDRQWLRENVDYLAKISDTTQNLKAAAREKFGRTGQGWDPLIEKSRKVLQHAQIVMDRD